MPQTPRRPTPVRGGPAVPERVLSLRGGASRVLLAAALLAATALVAPAPADAQGAPPSTAAPVPDASTMTPTRMPRPGSSRAFEHGGPGGSGRKTAEQRFEEANTSHDGHLTEAQAQAAHMRGVGTHFAEIDKGRRGYVTLDEIRAWRAERRAERKAEREKAGK